MGIRRPSKQLAGLPAISLEIPPEDQQTLIRVERGELNLEWLRLPSLGLSSTSTSKKGSVSLHLPLPTTPLPGRDAELAVLERLLQGPECRLLTLTGMGGTGKTRLAIELAIRQRSRFPGGIFFYFSRPSTFARPHHLQYRRSFRADVCRANRPEGTIIKLHGKSYETTLPAGVRQS